MHWIVEAKLEKDFKIRVKFNDGSEGVVDFSLLLDGEIFEPLKDQEFFSKFYVHSDLGALTWPNGADFSPDFIYKIVHSNHRKTA